MAKDMDKWGSLVNTVMKSLGSFLNYLSNCWLLKRGISMVLTVSSRLQNDTQFCYEDIVTVSLLASTPSLNTMYCNECKLTRRTHIPR